MYLQISDVRERFYKEQLVFRLIHLILTCFFETLLLWLLQYSAFKQGQDHFHSIPVLLILVCSNKVKNRLEHLARRYEIDVLLCRRVASKPCLTNYRALEVGIFTRTLSPGR
jgi:hypothetical protein